MTSHTAEQTAGSVLVGRSECVRQLRQQITRLAAYDVNLLLQGESGTGKELISRMVHNASRRQNGTFLGVNCAAIHETLLESELFGHESGAFTGAGRATLGFLRAADGGTLLLDEVGDMSQTLQRKLLRVIEQRAVIPVGGTRTVPIDIRFIAATHQDLSRAVQEGSFRADLYYRLNVVRLHIPPLRQRRCDIPLLADHFLDQISNLLKIPPKTFSPAALDRLMNYDWPGNIRELGNVIQRSYVLCDRPVIELDDLSNELRSPDQPNQVGREFPTLAEATRRHVIQALEMSDGVRTRAAQLLGIDRKTLWRMSHRFDLS